MLNIPTRDEIFLIQSGLSNYNRTKNTSQQVGTGGGAGGHHLPVGLL